MKRMVNVRNAIINAYEAAQEQLVTWLMVQQRKKFKLKI